MKLAIHIVCWLVLIGIALAWKLAGQSDTNPPLTVVIPKGRALRIVELPLSTNSPPPLPVPFAVQRPIEPFSRSSLLRELARHPRPGSQRFKAIKVEERVLNRVEDDGELRTNWLVTWLALPDGTNPAITWGAVKAGTFRTESRWPTRKDDEWEFSPIEETANEVAR